jgi:aminoglycoside phosphotransferase (APT) family kinase protein
MDFVEGEDDRAEDPARARSRDGARAAADQLGRLRRGVHTIDPRRFGLRVPGGDSPGAAEIGRYTQVLHDLAPDPHPTWRIAIRWLRARLPSRARATARPRRLPDRQRDRRSGRACGRCSTGELAHAGDPMEDLGWLCVRAWRFGNDDRPVGGLCAREELFEAYERSERHAGRPRRRALVGDLRQLQVGP